MALSITTSNPLINQVPSVIDAGFQQVAANLSDPDHSLNYTSNSSSLLFTVSYGAQSNISYVAISGHTMTNGSIEIWDDSTLIDSVSVSRPNNMMFTFPSMGFTDLKIKFLPVNPLDSITVSYIAAGQHMEIATGEQAGYKCNWLNRHLTQKTTSNILTAPVSSLTQAKSLKGSLTLPNQLTAFSEQQWQDFIDFAFEQPFFIKEQEANPASSYVCFDPKFETNSHSETLALNVLKLGFTVFNGL